MIRSACSDFRSTSTVNTLPVVIAAIFYMGGDLVLSSLNKCHGIFGGWLCGRCLIPVIRKLCLVFWFFFAPCVGYFDFVFCVGSFFDTCLCQIVVFSGFSGGVPRSVVLDADWGV